MGPFVLGVLQSTLLYECVRLFFLCVYLFVREYKMCVYVAYTIWDDKHSVLFPQSIFVMHFVLCFCLSFDSDIYRSNWRM